MLLKRMQKHWLLSVSTAFLALSFTASVNGQSTIDDSDITATQELAPDQIKVPIISGDAFRAATAAQASSNSSELHPFCPTDSTSWSRISHLELCENAAYMNRALALAGDLDSDAVVVLWRGHIVAERYWNDWNRHTPGPLFSASKGVVSTLYGIALDEGKIQQLDFAASNYVDQWKSKQDYQNITVEHLLTMTSGLEATRGTFARGIMARNEERFATQLSVDHSPGCYWAYQNSAYRLLFSILERITGQSLPAYSKEKLFDPLGMEHARWEHKRFAPNQYTHLECSALDAARFGLLIQRGGDWNGQQIVSQDWLIRATQPFSQDVNDSYGYLWWLNCGNAYRLPMKKTLHNGALFPRCPVDTIAALGARGQKIYIVPSLELVVVRLGDATSRNTSVHDSFDDQFLGDICQSFGYQN